MASKQTYECYVCKRNGFTDVRIFLDGKTEDGKTVYKNPDLTPHNHRQAQGQSTTIVTKATNEQQILSLLNDLNVKMNHVIKLLEGR